MLYSYKSYIIFRHYYFYLHIKVYGRKHNSQQKSNKALLGETVGLDLINNILNGYNTEKIWKV